MNGEVAPFVLDLAGHTAILPEYVEKFHIDTNVAGRLPYTNFLYKQVATTGIVSIIRSLLETTCSVMVFQLSF